MCGGHTLIQIEWLGRAPPGGTGSKEVTVGHVDFWGKRVPSRVNRRWRKPLEECCPVTWASRRSLWLLFET